MMVTDKPLSVEWDWTGISILQSQHSRAFVMPPSAHPFTKFLLPFAGAGELQFDGVSSLPIAPGTGILVPSGWRHQLRDAPGDPLSLFIFCFEDRVIGRTSRLRTHPLVISESAFHATLWDRIKEWRFALAQADGSAPDLLRAVGFWLLYKLQGSARRESSPGTDETPIEERILRELKSTFFLDQDLDQVCARWRMSRRNFTRRFRARTGESWHAMRQRLRIEYACLLLKDPRATISDAAFECGYGDLSTFYRSFQRITGQAPGAWRLSKLTAC